MAKSLTASVQHKYLMCSPGALYILQCHLQGVNVCVTRYITFKTCAHVVISVTAKKNISHIAVTC